MRVSVGGPRIGLNSTDGRKSHGRIFSHDEPSIDAQHLVADAGVHAARLELLVVPGLKDTVGERPYHSYFVPIKMLSDFCQKSGNFVRIQQKF